MASEVEKMIIDELRTLQAKVDRLIECQAELKVKADTRSGMIGLLGGLLPALGVAVYALVK